MLKQIIVYDSLTGNTEHFVQRMQKTKPDWQYLKIKPGLKMKDDFHLITYTTGMGEVPPLTLAFLENNHTKMLTVSASGNRNWGANYALAANKISETFKKPILEKFEVADYQEAINDMINKIERETYNNEN